MTSYEYDMLKLLLATSGPSINPYTFNCVPLLSGRVLYVINAALAIDRG